MNRFQFVADHQARYGVKRLCEILDLARSSFYYWRSTAAARAAREAADLKLAGQIKAVPPTVEVWHSVRAGGDTKTKKSRRTLALPQRCVNALRDHQKTQQDDRADAGTDRHENGLVFASRVGTELDSHNVRRAFRAVVKKAGMVPEEWTPRELRHSFVSILSDSGVSIQDIADLCGHAGTVVTVVTEKVYRHQLRPVLLGGAVAMDQIFAPTARSDG